MWLLQLTVKERPAAPSRLLMTPFYWFDFSQVCDDISKWTALLGSTLGCDPLVDNVSFIIEATGHRVGFNSVTPEKKVWRSKKCDREQS